jgi:hypothetical protein
MMLAVAWSLTVAEPDHRRARRAAATRAMLIVLADLACGAALGVLCNRELNGLRAEFGRDERKSGQALGATPGRTWG